MASHANMANRIYRVTEKFNNEQWKKFVKTHLSLTPHEIEEIELNYPKDYGEQKYLMVDRWMKRFGSTIDQLEKLSSQFHSHTPAQSPTGDLKSLEFSSSNSFQGRDEPSSLMPTKPYHTYSRAPTVPAHRQEPEAFVSQSLMPGPMSLELNSQSVMSQSSGTEQPINEKSVNNNYAKAFSENNSIKKNTPGNPDQGKTPQAPSQEKREKAEPSKPVEKATKSNEVAGSSSSGQGDMLHGATSKDGLGWMKKLKRTFSKKKSKTPANTSNGNSGKDYCGKVEKIIVKPATKEKYQQNEFMSMSGHEYRIKKKNKGRVLILNNKFLGQEDERKGAELDGKNMEQLWEQLGCHVHLEEDQDAEQMREEIRDMANTKKGKYDYIVVVIMSHGGITSREYRDERNVLVGGNVQEFFCGNDNKIVFLSDIINLFSNKMAPDLQGIPKFFILQFCRGTEIDSGTDLATDSNPQTLDEHLMNVMRHYACGSEIETDAADSNKLPTKCDIIIAYSTHLNNAALRDCREGSWFINAIVNIFMEFAHEEHVADLLTRVNGAMANKTGKVVKKINGKDVTLDVKAMSHHDTSLTKKFFLFPGHPK